MTRQAERPAALAPRRAAAQLGIGRTKVFELIRKGELRSFQVGRRRLVPVEEIERFIERGLNDDAR